MSFVVRVMRLGTEKPCISSLPQAITWWNSFSRTVKAEARGAFRRQKAAADGEHGAAQRDEQHLHAHVQMSPLVLPGVLMSVVSCVI